MDGRSRLSVVVPLGTRCERRAGLPQFKADPSGGCCLYALHIVKRRHPKATTVLAAELRRRLIADAVTRRTDISWCESNPFKKYRRVVVSASMMAVKGRIQREGEVVHLVAQRLTDLSGELASVGNREATFPLPYGRGDQVRNGGAGPDPRELAAKGLRTGDIYLP